MASRLPKVAVSASAAVKQVTPVVSTTREEARASVLAVYKKVQRMAPKFWWDYRLHDIPLPIFRAILKKQFTKNAHLSDLRIIDRKVAECEQDIVSVKWAFYNPEHVRNMLFRENIETKPKDFLTNFLNGKE
ncbi:hypothetical protein AB6A40_005822 [Gnathostoma spinigerum]|uniref:NADH dehydrogenase [ubiquinone] 1 alpha subcomplex subunit 6 n=1 Tax=Gnathostoma spinigerum TaxID=75299 RepID=A0ABD6EGR0_9BILA